MKTKYGNDYDENVICGSELIRHLAIAATSCMGPSNAQAV
jgi:hypothetical protein